MPQLEKTLQIGLKELEDKIHLGITSNSPLTYKRGRWETTVGDVKSILIVYEQHAEKIYFPEKAPADWPKDYKPSWYNPAAEEAFTDAPHYSISILLVQSGDEIRLCAMTSGSGQEQYGSSDSGGEYGLFETLDFTLENLDRIYA